jgi:hypothetical protein
VTTLEELRAHLNARHGADRPRLTLLPFLIRALVCAIPRFPQVNALFDDEKERTAPRSPAYRHCHGRRRDSWCRSSVTLRGWTFGVASKFPGWQPPRRNGRPRELSGLPSRLPVLGRLAAS